MFNIIRLSLLVILISILSCQISRSQVDEQAARIAARGMIAMNKADYELAARTFDSAMKIDPAPILYPYEKALAYYQMQQFDAAAFILDSLTALDAASDQIWQLLGNCYDYMKMKKNALDTYKEGLKKFPNSGRLYKELGVSTFREDWPRDALGYWETGVQAQPAYPDNYYYLAKYYENTGEKIWGLFYSEVFLNKTPNQVKADEISQVLYNTYNKALFNFIDSVRTISFTRVKVNVDLESKNKYIPFQTAYQLIMESLPEAQFSLLETKASIAQVSDIRIAFIKKWYSEGFDKKFPNIILEYQKAMDEDNVLEAYNYWILKNGAPEEFEAWKENHLKDLARLGKWLEINPLPISPEAYFSRQFYE